VIGLLFNCCEPESITKAIKEIRSNPQIHHHLHNPPEPLLPSTEALQTKNTQPVYLGAYANRLTPVDPSWTMESSEEAQATRDDLSPEQYWEEHVKLWHSADASVKGDGGGSHADGDVLDEVLGGVQIIGGCCAIGPGHISLLKERLAEK